MLFPSIPHTILWMQDFYVVQVCESRRNELANITSQIEFHYLMENNLPSEADLLLSQVDKYNLHFILGGLMKLHWNWTSPEGWGLCGKTMYGSNPYLQNTKIGS